MAHVRLKQALAGVVMVAACGAGLARGDEKTSWKFDFGGSGGGDVIAVKPDSLYTPDKGYGFEKTPEGQVASSAEGRAFVGTKPFYFSAQVPEGNYKVTVTLGNPGVGGSDTTIKAELRRLMVEDVKTVAYEPRTVDFIVNVRRPEIPDDGKVRLKAPRETTQEAWAWDDKLTLEFNGAKPAVEGLTIQKADVPTLYILGDSTVCDQSGWPYCSWGQMVTNFFKDDIAVANHAESGESIASSNGAGRFRKILSEIKPGDFFIEQYGHNDMKSKAPGAADKYEADLEQWVQQIRAKGAIPIVVTPMNRHTFKDGKVTDSLAPYPDKVRDVAAKDHVPLVDLNKMSAALYEALGEQGSEQLFEHKTADGPHDGTHHSPMGAYELARCVVQGIRASCPELAKHIKADVTPFDPSKPDFTLESQFKVPVSPRQMTMAPLGAGGVNR
ncbi:MAG TPA: rhamnogalacturonan acetylesterase [Phycisphaerae bacterium]|nr:rhamnogalacturonan acetylesterase [Phycisphaerae bacterium]